MKRFYIVEFTATRTDDGITYPVLPWDGLGLPVRYIAKPDGVGGYAENFVLAVVGGIRHGEFMNKPGVYQMPDVGTSNNLGAMAPGTKTAMLDRLRAINVNTQGYDNNTDIATVLRDAGSRLKPGFDPTTFDVNDQV